MDPTKQQHITDTIADWLTHGLMTPMQGLERADVLRKEGKRELADVLKAAVQAWHTAELARIAAATARGI